MTRRGDIDAGVVYSTDTGRICPRCGKRADKCGCSRAEKRGEAPQASQQKKDGTVRIRKERKGRNGKDATVIAGVPLAESKLQELAKELKQKCGAGGSIKDGAIEIQGDHAATVAPLLRARGFTVKGA